MMFFVRRELIEEIAAWRARWAIAVSLDTHAVVDGVWGVGEGARDLIAIVGDVHSALTGVGREFIACVMRGWRNKRGL